MFKKIVKNVISSLRQSTRRISFSFTLMLGLSMIIQATGAGTLRAADTAMKHTPPDYFVSEHRMQLDVDVRDPGGINLVRCYFKAAGEADLVFVPMNPAGANKYAGILPAPSATTDQVEYLFLAVTGANQVVRSQTFYLYKDNTRNKPAWQDIPKDGEIRVSMELDAAPKELRGFSDNVTIDVVESGVRFGVVALLYDASQTGSGAGLSGSAASATSAGSITAEAAGLSTTMIAAGVVGAAAVGGGIAAAGGSSGGGKSAAEELTSTTILGNWKFSGNRRDGGRRNGTIDFNENGTHTYTVKDADGQSDSSGSGNWSLSETILTITFQTISTWNGTVSGDSKKFTLDTTTGTNHGIYTFTR
jgi:hypothetical protein